MTFFDYNPRTRIVFGAGAIDQLGALAAELGGRRALIVTDPGIVAAGHVARAQASLTSAGLKVVVFDGVEENPTTHHVDAGLAVAREHEIDLLVGLGGGSSMDCAKGINFLLTNGGKMADYWGVGKATKPMLPMIGVPTTAGTGSECQSFALIADPDTHQKMACGDKKAACRIALLDPVLTVSQPPAVTAASGIDALSHAIESYVTLAATPISQAFSRQAWQLLEPSFEIVLREPGNLKARSSMLLGAALAGMAIENSMLGAAHSCANPLTARFGITHGLAVALMLPHVIRFNRTAVGHQYEKLAAAAGRNGPLSDDAADWLAGRFEQLRQSAGIKGRLSDFGVADNVLAELAHEAAGQWTAAYNPRPVNEHDLLELYRCAL
jgi:alcohol dehydrogenase